MDNQRLINDYKIWEEATKNNKNPNDFFPIQIPSVYTILNRHKSLEKGILRPFFFLFFFFIYSLIFIFYFFSKTFFFADFLIFEFNSFNKLVNP